MQTLNQKDNFMHLTRDYGPYCIKYINAVDTSSHFY